MRIAWNTHPTPLWFLWFFWFFWLLWFIPRCYNIAHSPLGPTQPPNRCPLLQKTLILHKKILSRLVSVLEDTRWGYPALLLLVGLASYGYALLQLGFYWDDWEVVYLTHLAGLQDLLAYFSFDRPFAWPYPLYAVITGANPLGWHLITLLLRFGGIALLYYTFVSLWPARKFELRWMGLILMVFPSFLQQSISTAYSRHFTSFFLFSLSLYWSTRAVRAPSHRWLYWIGAFVTGALQIFTIEYYAGLELIRPIVLWLALEQERSPKKLQRIAASWAPFLLAFIAFLWWRLVYFASQHPGIKSQGNGIFSSMLKAPLNTTLALLQTVFSDAFRLVFQTWIINVYNPDLLNFTATITLFALLLALLLAGAAFGTIRQGNAAQDGFPRQAFILGCAAVVAGGLPVWAFGKSIVAGGRWGDRFSQAPMIGAALLLVVLVSVLVRARWKPAILAILLGLAIMTQVAVVNKYRLDWEAQKNLFWQMYWRAPALLPNTAIYSTFIPSTNLPYYDTSYAFSLLYSSEKTGTHIPYWLFTAESIRSARIGPDTPTHGTFRNIRFAGESSSGIAVSYPVSSGCLQVLSPIFQGGNQSALIPLSNLSRIQPSSKHVPDPATFGAEPAHAWCYYFEKGDLARQTKDWNGAIALYKQANQLGLSPRNGAEYLPFIDAYAAQNNFDEALRLSDLAQKTSADVKPMLCANWQRFAGVGTLPAPILAKVRASYACSW